MTVIEDGSGCESRRLRQWPGGVAPAGRRVHATPAFHSPEPHQTARAGVIAATAPGQVRGMAALGVPASAVVDSLSALPANSKAGGPLGAINTVALRSLPFVFRLPPEFACLPRRKSAAQ